MEFLCFICSEKVANSDELEDHINVVHWEIFRDSNPKSDLNPNLNLISNLNPNSIPNSNPNSKESCQEDDPAPNNEDNHQAHERVQMVNCLENESLQKIGAVVQSKESEKAIETNYTGNELAKHIEENERQQTIEVSFQGRKKQCLASNVEVNRQESESQQVASCSSFKSVTHQKGLCGRKNNEKKTVERKGKIQLKNSECLDKPDFHNHEAPIKVNYWGVQGKTQPSSCLKLFL
jgi:hypothetical protein